MEKFLCFLFLGGLQFFNAFAQEDLTKTLPLNDLSAFRSQAGNWQIVGEVTMDRTVDVHHKEEVPAATGKKKKKKKTEESQLPQAVSFQPGTGILLNQNTDLVKDHLVTVFEHGDIELEMEVMLPKGSNSGLYLQGRYEIQLLDSWGVQNPKYSDIGGIYRNWETEPGKIYMGKAPLTNAAKAPGLWQTIKLLFKAPKFDENGNKTENARFVYVLLNGVRIHDNVEAPLPTGGPLENNEKPMGPIMIQGDHGPVAIRNFKYKLLHNLDVSLSDLSYKAFHGDFKSFADIEGKQPQLSGKTPVLTYQVAEKDNAFAVIFDGSINVDEDGTYLFFPELAGGVRLTVNGEKLLDLDRADGYLRNQPVTIELKKGTYPIQLQMLKNVSWMSPRLGLFVKKADTYPVALHAFSSNPPNEYNVSPVLVRTGHKPKLLRAFIDFKGQGDQRITHSIGVGHPDGIHYVYDLKNGNIVCVWRGEFVNATPMWHDRGDGSFRPLGATIFLLNNQQIATLNSSNEPFPELSTEGDFRSLGYEIEATTGTPVFNYTYKNTQVKDRIFPDENKASFVREISVENPEQTEALKFKLAEGKKIEEMPDGSFAIDDKQYYIKVLSGQLPEVREINGTKELVLPVANNSIKYSIIW